MITTTRRTLIAGIGAMLCAPAIVRASSLMPVSVWDDLVTAPHHLLGFGIVAIEPLSNYHAETCLTYLGRDKMGRPLFWAAEPIRKGSPVVITKHSTGEYLVRNAMPGNRPSMAVTDSLRERDILPEWRSFHAG